MSIAKTKFIIMAAVAIAIGVGGPVGYWFISLALDRAIGLRPFAVYPVSLILAAAAFLIGVFWAFWSYSYLIFVGKGLPLEVFGRALHPTSGSGRRSAGGPVGRSRQDRVRPAHLIAP